MMKRNCLISSVGILLLLLVIIVQADIEVDPFIPCETDEECIEFVSPYSYCNVLTSTCFIPGTTPTNQTILPTTNITLVPSVPPTDDTFIILQSRLDTLEGGASLLQQQIEGISYKVDQLDQVNTKITEVEGKLDQFNTNLQSVNYQQEQNKEELKKEVTKAVTGLAVLQDNLNQTQTELSQVQEDLGSKGFWLKFISYLFLTLVIVTAAVVSAYYYNAKKKREQQFDAELTPSIHAYLTQQIRLGKKFPQIKDNLLQSGWSEEEARWAYKETMKHNYSKYISKNAPKEAPAAPQVKLPQFNLKSLFQHDVTKVLSILIFATLLILGGLLILRGVSTGKAIYQQEGSLEVNVKNVLETNLINNPFYSKIEFIDLCIQVENNGESTSYRWLKTNLGYALQKADSCDNYPEAYDLAVKFTDYASFDYLMNGLGCNSIRGVNKLEKKVWILPSKYVLPGFSLNPEKDASKFCAALKDCLSVEELQKYEISC
ncbi:MAG: hypothetical protein V2A62_00220 [Candidatus Woesearchaeota archaeon]